MRRKRRKKKNLRIILTALLVAAFVAALGAVLIWKVFVVKDVSVKGNEIYTDKQIEDWVFDEKYSWNSLYVYFENKLNKTEEIPFVDSLQWWKRESLDICTFRHWEKMHILTKMDLWWNFPLR